MKILDSKFDYLAFLVIAGLSIWTLTGRLKSALTCKIFQGIGLPFSMHGDIYPLDPETGLPVGSHYFIEYAISVTPLMLLILMSFFLTPYYTFRLASKALKKPFHEILAIGLSLMIGWSALFFIYMNPETAWPVAGCERDASIKVHIVEDALKYNETLQNK